MKPWLKFCTQGVRFGASCVGSFALWTLWLALALLLVVQIYVASSHELAVPPFILRQMEQRLADAGVQVKFGRTSFDPTGRILVEDVRLFLPAFAEPVLTARAVYVRLNPRALLLGQVEGAELQVMHAAVFAPAQLSPSGRSEEIISTLEATLTPTRHELIIRQASARLANLTLSARGTVALPPARDKTPGPQFLELAARHFPALCRQALAAQAKLSQLEEPALHLEIHPGPAGRSLLTVQTLARKVRLEGAYAGEVDDVVATTQVTLPSATPLGPLQVSAAAVRLANGATAHGLTARAVGQFRPGQLAFDVQEVTLAVDALSVLGVDAAAISGRLSPQPLPGLKADLSARLLGAPIALQATTDLATGSARVQFAGAISPRVLDVISARVGRDVRRWYDFESLEAEAGDATFAAGWKFAKLTARVRVPRMNSYGVIMEDGRATVELEPGRFYSPEAYARVGGNFARGTYEHDLRTHEFRFLLTGRLRPLAISPWFGSWWPNFFNQLEFPLGPAEASVDVAGFWRQGRRTRLFIYGETPRVLFRGAALDTTRTLLVIRPGYFDALQLLTTSGEGTTRGTFTYRANEDNEWVRLDFAGESNLDLDLTARLLGPAIARNLSPYHVAAAPELKVRGVLHGRGALEKSEDFLQIEARTTGEFRFHNFPIQDVAFLAKLQGSDVTVERFNGSFAGGAVSGNARVWGAATDRRVGFNLAIEKANLGPAVTTLQTFLAQRRGQPPAPPGRFVQERANVELNVAASAEGRYENPLSFRGTGNANLKGAAIGEVPLLGLLSDLFTFTSLRFTEAGGNFKIDGPKLVFPKIELRGSNSAIEAHGEYTLDQSELNFMAKVFPFQESNNLIKSVVGAVLTPISNVLEVKLTGTFEKPNWAFVMGPQNFLRALVGGNSTEPAKPAEPPPATPAPNPQPPAPPATPPQEPTKP